MRKWNRILLAGGVLLMLSGALHVPLQLFAPRDWESLIGWRKPILFGLSTGMTLMSLAWVESFISNKISRIVAAIVSILAVAEVSIITIQTWRSVPAHFNDGAIFDQILGNSIDVMLIFITLGIFYFTWRTLRTNVSNKVSSDYLSAIRLGMIYLSVACLLGFGVAIYGNYMLSVGGNPEVVNPNGVPKFVHGMPIHALQILPIYLFVISLFNSNIKNRRKSVVWVAVAIAVSTVYAFWQTANGLGRFDVNAVGVILLIMFGLSGVMAFYFAFIKRADFR